MVMPPPYQLNTHLALIAPAEIIDWLPIRRGATLSDWYDPPPEYVRYIAGWSQIGRHNELGIGNIFSKLLRINIRDIFNSHCIKFISS